MNNSRGVLLLGERIEGGGLASITKELLGIGRKLVDKLGEELSLLLLGEGPEEISQEAISLGADKVFLAENPVLTRYQPEYYCSVACRVCGEYSPSIFLSGQTDLGRDLAPRIAARLGTGLSLDCLTLKIAPGTRLLVMTKPVYGGNALMERICEKARPQMATIRPKSQSPAEPDSKRQGQAIKVPFQLEPTGKEVQVIQRVKQEVEGMKLEEAEVVVTGGRGIGGPEGFEMLRELARLLGGAIAGSRSACEEGWLPTSLQVGQTGKIVSPNLYIAIALSGAMQHLAGCLGSKNIIAINRDPEANIFRVARFGLVADYRQAVPVLIRKLKELLEK